MPELWQKTGMTLLEMAMNAWMERATLTTNVYLPQFRRSFLTGPNVAAPLGMNAGKVLVKGGRTCLRRQGDLRHESAQTCWKNQSTTNGVWQKEEEQPKICQKIMKFKKLRTVTVQKLLRLQLKLQLKHQLKHQLRLQLRHQLWLQLNLLLKLQPKQQLKLAPLDVLVKPQPTPRNLPWLEILEIHSTMSFRL